MSGRPERDGIGRRVARGLALLASLLAGLACAPGEPAHAPPHAIVLVSLDTLRGDMLGLYGYDEYPTSPFLDGLAREAVVFENAIVSAPRTLPSHMSLFTALPPHEHRVDDEHPLEPGIPTLAERLRERGYRTQAFVDGGYLRARWGLERGFDHYDEGDRNGFASVLPRAKAWIAEAGDDPFFLFLHTYDVHAVGMHPYYPSPEPFHGMFSDGIASDLDTSSREAFQQSFLDERYRLDDDDRRLVKATYAEGIRHVDEELRSLFGFLRGFAWYDDALIVIWSDHGEGLYDHVDFSHGEVFDHTIRVPLLIRFPGAAHAGRRVASVVQSLDLAPTLLELAGAPPLGSGEGRSLLPLLESEDESRLAFSARTLKKSRRFSLRTRDFHYVWHAREDEHMLFDLRDDPGEQRDRAGEGLPQEPLLRRRLEAWVTEHDRRRSEPRRAGVVRIDATTEAGLRALGYIE